MPDLLVRAIDASAGVRVIAAITTDLVREAAGRHQASGLGACALGRGLTSGLLLATLTKGAERVTLQIRSGGPLGGMTIDAIVDSTGTGDVRGYVSAPGATARPCVGRGRLAEAIGRDGILNVLRDVGQAERYQGQVPLLTGEIDEDVEHYLRVSEQVPSALGCDVFLGDGQSVDAAGGVLVQALPGATSDEVWEAQHAVRTGSVHRYLAAGGRDAGALAERVYGKPLELLGQQPLRFHCRCTSERVHQVLRLLTVVDIDEMIANPGFAEVTCNYCSTRYVADKDELERVRADLARGPRAFN